VVGTQPAQRRAEEAVRAVAVADVNELLTRDLDVLSMTW
jgi:hypothetical protein